MRLYIGFYGNLCSLRIYLRDDVLTWGAEVVQNMYCALIGSWNLVVFVKEKLEIPLSRDTHCTRRIFFVMTRDYSGRSCTFRNSSGT